MNSVLASLISTLLVSFRSRLVLQAEILALRHQLNILQKFSKRRTRLCAPDPILWIWLSQQWSDWRSALLIVRPETVIRWHRQGFRLYWQLKSPRPARPDTERQMRELIRKMCAANTTWGAPRIHAELLKLGIDVSQTTVSKYMVRRPKPPSHSLSTRKNPRKADSGVAVQYHSGTASACETAVLQLKGSGRRTYHQQTRSVLLMFAVIVPQGGNQAATRT
jgi:putative transposase